MTRRKAISYIRFSHPSQAVGDSLRRQFLEAQKYAELNDLDLDLSFQDEGISAFRGRHRTRGALSRLLELIENGRVKPGTVLLVEHLDRLSREDPMTAMQQLSGLINAGIEVVTLLGGHPQIYNQKILKSQPGRLFEVVGMMLRANEESEAKSKRISSAWARKRELARDGIPMTSECPAWLKRVGNGFKVIPERRDVVRQIFEMSIGGLGKMLIAKRLNEAGVAPFTSAAKGWHSSYITKVLNNPAVIGSFLPGIRINGRRELAAAAIQDYYPRVIDNETYWHVQALKGKRTGGRRGRTFANIFSGLLKCGVCGGSVVHEDKGRKKANHGDSRWLVCDIARRAAGCSNKTRLRYGDVERTLLYNLAAILPNNSGDTTALAAQAQEMATTAFARREGARSLAAQFASGKQSRSVLEVVQELDAEADEIERKLAEINVKLVEARRRPFIEQTKELRRTFTLLDTAEGQELFELRAQLNDAAKLQVDHISLFPNRTWVAITKEDDVHSYEGNVRTKEDIDEELAFTVAAARDHNLISKKRRKKSQAK